MIKKVFIGEKKFEYYDGLLIRADTGLHDQIGEVIRDHVRVGASVLDMGAGQGALSARLSDLGYQVTAVDSNDEDYQVDKVDNRNIDYLHVNFDDERELEAFIQENQSKFDAVCGVEVIEHVENPWAYVRGLVRLAKKDGLVLVTTPNTTSWLSRLRFLMSGQFLCFGEENLEYGHISPISDFELNLVMTRAGLREVTIRSGGTLPPLYFSSPFMVVKSLICLCLRPFQKGTLDGWCIIGTGRK